jgi:hypothetical protein
MALLRTMSKKVLSLLWKRRKFKILTLLFYSEIWVVLYSLFWVRHLFYSLWVNIALYSGFRCHCECILFYSEIWVKFYSLFCVKPVVYSQWVKIALYSSFMCHCECILFYSEIWVIFTQTLCVTVNAFFYSNIWVVLIKDFLQCILLHVDRFSVQNTIYSVIFIFYFGSSVRLRSKEGIRKYLLRYLH